MTRSAFIENRTTTRKIANTGPEVVFSVRSPRGLIKNRVETNFAFVIERDILHETTGLHSLEPHTHLAFPSCTNSATLSTLIKGLSPSSP
ncbi:hypothetical protein FIBSPDRAFT_1050688 [Athelia psychrophila]|uniref:Uncharacterized protein n=1 Tax=Athelia psychrophila TaxID=1759441 RepID=A0A166AF19_9AGAM|nr:hypothetical protein FIBSPDRAFT_1050684 [Fibularhizoctonia sp. CBS 109695]KZP11540.1 hypothetical protein FIBSPDRAFT_1050688 [Fibularhizoctonia sp. CBS 109695]